MIRRLLVVAVMGGIVLLIAAWAWNLVPGLRIDASKQDRRECMLHGEGAYHFSVPDHAWVCHDNWFVVFLDAGVHGV